uniref:Uncharacterized protein DDB_G0274171-like n=1 Tax=Diabrotica virgifera virgifera TaxID=50390 RepID=A0A6P7EZF9_DIAVI
MWYLVFTFLNISYVFAANPNCTQIPEYCPTDEECTRVDCFEPETCGKGLVLKKLPCRCCRECVPVNCEVNCAAVQCLKPTCPRGQIPTTFRCRCCPRCAPAEYEPFCDGVRCLAVACRPNEVRYKPPCRCCPICIAWPFIETI